jgi:phosphoglycolate phosphatase
VATRLVLFDIDGTLVNAAGAGQRAMTAAGRDVLGPSFSMEGVRFAGNLDRLIFEDACRRSGLEPTGAHRDEFRRRYVDHLEAHLAEAEAFRTLPGARAAFERVHARAETTLGLLTGNYADAARLKLRRGELDFDAVEVGAYGDEAADRDALVPLARERYQALRGEPLDFADVLIVGDTPADVQCALAHGCALIAVTTGRYDADALHAAGARRVLDSLDGADL